MQIDPEYFLFMPLLAQMTQVTGCLCISDLACFYPVPAGACGFLQTGNCTLFKLKKNAFKKRNITAKSFIKITYKI
jgi:hypothetical protein